MVSKVLVVGLGNPNLCDDSVGLRIAEALKSRINQEGVDVVEASVAGLDFLDLLLGYEKAIIVDAVQTAKGEAGQIYRLESGTFNTTRHASTPHDVNFATALELGKKLNLPLPKQILIFGVEVKDVSTVAEECTPEVEHAIPLCIEMVAKELNGGVD